MKSILLIFLLIFMINFSSFARDISNEQKIAGLYVAFFNRAPDMNGLNYWKSRTDEILAHGKDPMVVFKEISKGFSTHPVFTSIYGNLNNKEFVEAIYRNVLGREGDSEGVNYWTSLLDGNNGVNPLSRSDMVANFVNTSLTVDLTPQNFPTLSTDELNAAKLRQDLITNKTEVALEFVNQLGDKTNVVDYENPENDPAYKASIKILSEVTEDSSTVQVTQEYLADIKEDSKSIDEILLSWGEKYPLHTNITTTVFWVGEESSIENKFIANKASAWDDNWMCDYGGVDDPDSRNGYFPSSFTPLENPFYFALPYDDLDENGSRKNEATHIIPWSTGENNNSVSILKNRWIKIIKDGKTAYAQWEDVGPIYDNDSHYVFGYAKPSSTFNNNAGLDVSPAVRDYLGLNGEEMTSWQFVDAKNVPDGPWKQIITTSQPNWTQWYKPDVNVTWQWQLTGDINISYDVDIYDLDLFETDISTIEALHKKDKKVICYFSAGSYEEWRSDAGKFPAEAIGNDLDGWAGEKWLDIRDDSIKQIMLDRLDLAKEKGCDGVEPDNVDGYANDTGFPLSEEDQLLYNKFIANEAHKRGLSVGLKNDLEQINILEPFFDFAINEQCHIYDECGYMQPFIDANKPVLNVEYADKYVNNTNTDRDKMCNDSKNRGFYTIIMPLNLDDSFRYQCD